MSVREDAHVCYSSSSPSGGGGGELPPSLVIGAGVGGSVAAPVVIWSAYTLAVSGCGLPPGPAGLLGAAEGVSYLSVVALVGWSAFTKVKTGSGLPPGPAGLLGAAEGFSYLALLAAIGAFGYQLATRQFIPGALPTPECFG